MIKNAITLLFLLLTPFSDSCWPEPQEVRMTVSRHLMGPFCMNHTRFRATQQQNIRKTAPQWLCKLTWLFHSMRCTDFQDLVPGVLTNVSTKVATTRGVLYPFHSISQEGSALPQMPRCETPMVGRGSSAAASLHSEVENPELSLLWAVPAAAPLHDSIPVIHPLIYRWTFGKFQVCISRIKFLPTYLLCDILTPIHREFWNEGLPFPWILFFKNAIFLWSSMMTQGDKSLWVSQTWWFRA